MSMLKNSLADEKAQTKKNCTPVSDYEKKPRNDKIQSLMANLKMALDEERTNKCANGGIFQTAHLTCCALSECVCVCFFFTLAILSFGVFHMQMYELFKLPGFPQCQCSELCFVRANISPNALICLLGMVFISFH